MQMGTRVGLVDAWGATQWLPLVVGERRAREMLLTCDEVTAEQALNWGLVNQVVPLKQLDRAVNALAKKLIQKFPECTRYTRQQLDTVERFGVDPYRRPRARLACRARHFMGALRGHSGLH